MKTMLILTDFSEVAFRAAEYACELAGPLHINRIILFHAYQTLAASADIAGTAPIIDPQLYDDRQVYLASMESLGLLHDRLKPMLEPAVNIDLVAENAGLADLVDLINQRSRNESIDMIVMGVSGKSGLEKFLLGSTTTKILREGEWPVLIVPPETLLGRTIKTIVFTSDLERVDSIPTHQLYDLLNALPGKLQVINVERKVAEKFSPEMENAIAGLHELLEKYDPDFHYITGDDIGREILAFAEQQHASLIIAVHQKRRFLSNLFHESITKKLAYNSKIPLLSLPGL
jgi:nucleotide-binding universal stress UspA family protein